MKKRCSWAASDPLYIHYHDEEWGVPVHDDRKLFEFLILDGAQAGLSWLTILRKRDRYLQVFEGFEPATVALYDQGKVEELLRDPGIIRNRAKVNSAISNARAFLEVQKEFGAFDRYIWSFVGGKTIVNRWETLREIPASTVESKAMSRSLKERGFRFVGPTICYAFMQAAGLVNDHTTDCFRWEECRRLAL